MTSPEPTHRDTDIATFFEDLDGGVFIQKLARALSEVAGGVVDNNDKGRVDIQMNLKRIGSSFQVNIGSTLKYTVPTLRGKISEEDTTETPMYVNTGGKLSIFPENQGQLLTKQGVPNPHHEED